MPKRPNPPFEVRMLAVNAVLQKGKNPYDVAEMFGVEPTTVYKWLRKFKSTGNPDVLRHKSGAGAPRKLSELEVLDLISAVLQPASEYGNETDLWTVQRLQKLIKQRYRKKVSEDTVWRLLRDAGFTYQKPLKKYIQANDAQKKEWVRDTWPEIVEKVRKTKGILFFEDECSIQLSPFVGKTWAPKGSPPVIKITGKRGSIAAVSAISSSGRLFFRLYEKTIRSKEIVDFLSQLLSEYPRRHLVVVMDQAPSHVSKETKAFIAAQRRLHVFFLPPYCPELNADEKVWNHLKHNELKAHRANSKAELKRLVNKKLKRLSKNRKAVKTIYKRSDVSKI